MSPLQRLPHGGITFIASTSKEKGGGGGEVSSQGCAGLDFLQHALEESPELPARPVLQSCGDVLGATLSLQSSSPTTTVTISHWMRVWLCLGCPFLFLLTQSLLTITGPEEEPCNAARCDLAQPACPFELVALPVGCEGLLGPMQFQRPLLPCSIAPAASPE